MSNGALPTCEVPEIDALILFPSLGVPQILPPNPSECTIIIATNAKGRRELKDPCKGAVLVNHHLRLMSLKEAKEKQPSPCDHGLYDDITEDYYHREKQNNETNGKMLRAQYIEINELELASGNLLTWPLPAAQARRSAPDETSTERIIGRLSPEMRSLCGGTFGYYFAITLKNPGSSEAQLSGIPKSWAWIVTTKAEAGHWFIGPDGQPSNDEAHWPAAFKPHHYPLDRLIHNKFVQLAKDPSVNGSLMDVGGLYEIKVGEGQYEAPQKGEPALRVQAWHPAVLSKENKALKLGHLTDFHISVRAATIAQSPVKVIEGIDTQSVGNRLAHTFKSFKALLDTMVGKSDALAITGDAIDFNRNLDPQTTQNKKSIAEVWSILNAIANVRNPKSGYRRGVDQLYLYSLFMYALRDKKLPAFYITGNHEGYMWPYGISPRVDDNILSAAASNRGEHETNYSGAMDRFTGEDRKAYEALQAAQEELTAANARQIEAERAFKQADASIGVAKPSELPELRDAWNKAQRERTNSNMALEDAKARVAAAQREHNARAQALGDFWDRNIEQASAYHSKKATECIPSDHNLTIYEACLAYGPTYGQTLVSYNFRREQFDWIHWLYTPFSDLNVYPCCTDLLGEGSNQILTLLGWGGSERLLPELTWLVTGNTKGADRRGRGFLPYAPESIGPSQLALIDKASRHKKSESVRWSVLSHFTVANFEDTVPAGINENETGFHARNESVSKWNTWGDRNAQFNAFNWGGCEVGLCTYLKEYTAFRTRASYRQVDLHLSGHSHRCGVYTLSERSAHYKGGQLESISVSIQCRVPQFPSLGELPRRDAGTRFIVGSTAGPLGKQAVAGWDTGGLLGKAGWKNTKPGGALLDGWLTRPPSGLVVDTGSEAIDYVKADGHEKRNDLPRLAVMLDYREIMSLCEKKHETRPIILCPEGQGGPRRFDTGLLVTLSEEAMALDCLNLAKARVWVYRAGAAKARPKSDDDGKPAAATTASQGSWLLSNTPIKHVSGRRHQLLCDAGSADTLRKSLVTYRGLGSNFEASLCAFMEIPLKMPQYSGIPLKEIKYEGESWVFPVEIYRAVQLEGGFRETIKRDEGEKGEIPKWGFLAEHFGHLGYPSHRSVIRPG